MDRDALQHLKGDQDQGGEGDGQETDEGPEIVNAVGGIFPKPRQRQSKNLV